MGNTLVSLFCVVDAILLIIVLGYVLNRSKKKSKGSDATTKPTNKKPGWQGWLLPLGVTFILCVWSIVFALFFLSIVWVMQLDPKIDSKEIPFPSDKDRKRAKGTYTWLLVSPILNVIIFAIAAINLDWNSNANERVVAALVPLIVHLPVLLKLDSKSPFVFRHTQQAVFLLALRASMAALALNISKYPDEGIWLFLLGNGFLWLFGSLWGRSQAHRGICWWIKQRGEKVLSPDAVPTDESTKSDELDNLLKSMNVEGNTPRQKALNAFRTGSPEIRKKGLLVLSQLGEVEKF